MSETELLQRRLERERQARQEAERLLEQKSRELYELNQELLRAEISERRQAEEERDSFFTLSLDLLCIGATDAHLKRVNPAFERILGWKSGELLTKSFLEIVHPADQTATAAEVEKLVSGVPASDFENRCLCKDGSYRWIAWKVSSVPEKGIFYAYGRDITDRNRAEEALRQSEQRFRELAENINDVFWLSSPDKNQIIYISPAYEEIWGRGCQSLYASPRTWLDAIHEEDRERVIQAALNKQTSGEYSEIYRILRPDGSMRWIHDRAFPIRDESGRVYRVAGIAEDITEQKLAQEELNELHRELLTASRQAGMAEVATGVLHNVGNVLNSVNISATLVSENLKESKVRNLSRVAALFHEHAADLGAFLTADSKGRQLPAYLDQLSQHLAEEHATLLKELELLKQNIEHIKDVVAMQQSYAKVAGVTETVKVADLVEDALRMNAGALERHGVRIVRELHDAQRISVEKHKVLQILVNLIRNAKYACQESGKPDKQLTVRLSNVDDRVRIAVSDNGIGIPKENLTRIFNHGFTTRKDGHGFGLHSGALAARELGGSLQVHSDGSGHGATFTLELPIQSPRPANP